MKKFLSIFVFLLAATAAFSQFPNNQGLSNANTLLTINGGIQFRYGAMYYDFTDTATANLNAYMKGIPGQEIRTGNEKWIRNTTANAWIKSNNTYTGSQSVLLTGSNFTLVNDVTSPGNNYMYGTNTSGTKGYNKTFPLVFTSPSDGQALVLDIVGADTSIINYTIPTVAPGGSTTQVQYNNAGAFAGSANMVFSGTKLTIAGSASAATFNIGSLSLQNLGTNNTVYGDNVQYASGFKSVVSGYTPMIYMPNGAVEIWASGTTTGAGVAASHSPKISSTSTGTFIGVNVSGLTASAGLMLSNVTNSAGRAPLKFYLTGAAIMPTPEAGAVEIITTRFYYTNSLAIRQDLQQVQQSYVTTQYDNTTTTLGNVTGLTANVGAAGVYRFEAKLFTTSNVAGGVKAAIAGTATATSIMYEGLTTDAGLTTQSRGAAMAAVVGAVTAVTAAYITIEGTITVNAAGTLTVQLAANAATGTTSALTGSTFTVYQVL